MVDVVKDRTAAVTATTVVTAKATEVIVNMIIDYSSEQTKTDEEVSKEYEEENGSLPEKTTVSSYQTTILPGASVTPGHQGDSQVSHCGRARKKCDGQNRGEPDDL